MPLFQIKDINGFGKLGIWKIAETEEYFLKRLNLSTHEQEELQRKRKKKLAWLASRWLLHIMIGSEERILWQKNRYGKPELIGSDLQFSISHSGQFCAVLVGNDPVGIDIQLKVDKIKRIQSKFVSENEQHWLPNQRHWEHLHVIWSVKEAIYKCIGKKGVSLKGQIHLNPYVRELQRGSALVQQEDQSTTFIFFFDFLDNYVIAGTRCQ